MVRNIECEWFMMWPVWHSKAATYISNMNFIHINCSYQVRISSVNLSFNLVQVETPFKEFLNSEFEFQNSNLSSWGKLLKQMLAEFEFWLSKAKYKKLLISGGNKIQFEFWWKLNKRFHLGPVRRSYETFANFEFWSKS